MRGDVRDVASSQSAVSQQMVSETSAVSQQSVSKWSAKYFTPQTHQKSENFLKLGKHCSKITFSKISV